MKSDDKGRRLYECDVCQKMKPNCQLISAYGMDTVTCDECRGYDPKDYGENDAEDPS